jgi:autotransporter-associated beta strand protein
MNRLFKVFIILAAGALVGTVATAAPATYARKAGYNFAWTNTVYWTNTSSGTTGYPGADTGDTAVFGLATGERVDMSSDQTVGSVIVTNTGAWEWRYVGARVLNVNNVFVYSNSATSYFGDIFGQAQNTIAAVGGTGKVRVERGTLNLMSPQNAYSGGTEINGGTLQANVNRRSLGTFLGSGPIDIGATTGPDRDASLWLSMNGDITYAMAITNRSGNAGRSIIGRNHSGGAAAGIITLSGGLTLQKDVELHNTTLDRAGWTTGGQLRMLGAISGTGALTTDGFGWTRFQAVNSYVGDTTVKRGLLTLENASNSALGDYFVKGGLLMIVVDASLGNVAHTLTLGDSGTFGGFGPYNATINVDRNIALTGNGGFLQSYFYGSYRQAGTGILSGPGKLIVSMPAGAQFTNNNTYSGGTVIADGTADSSTGAANNNNLFGVGDVEVRFNSALNLRGNGNVASGKKILVTRTGDNLTGTRAALRLPAAVTTVPAIDPASAGILMLNASSSTVLNDLVSTSAPQLGNGYMLIASDGYTFSGASLQANLDDVYRLGALNALIILNAAGAGVLTGANSVEIGQPASAPYAYGGARTYRRGFVQTLDANDYTGTTTVFQVSQFRGSAQTTAGLTPFGDTNSPVVLLGGELYLDGVSSGQPVDKGQVTVDGYGVLSLGSGFAGNRLTFASLNRVGSSAVYLYAPGSPLGSAQASLMIHSGMPATANNMLPPYFLNITRDFMNYTATGFTNVVYTHASLAGVDSTSIVNLPGDATVSGTVNVYAMKTAGILGGTAVDLLRIHSGGLILAAAKTHTAPIEFVSEGVIQDDLGCTFSGKLTGSSGLVKMGGAVTILNGDSSATLSGPITINQGELRLGVAGAIPQTAPITLNGGSLACRINPSTWSNSIALGTVGGSMGGQVDANVTFAGSITGGAGSGPLVLAGASTIISNSYNTYQGGTIMAPGRAVVRPWSSLGSGNVTVETGANLGTAGSLTLEGNANISPTARVYLVGQGSVIQFFCPSPSIGSLEGGGEVRLAGSLDSAQQQASNCRLTVGGNDQDTEYFGRIRPLTSGFGTLPARDQLVKVGTGNLTLWGENAYGGGTMISNGTLTVNNWINTDGWVAISPLGTLAGIGTVGPVTNNGGTISGSVRMPSLVLGTGSKVGVTLNGTTPVSEYSQLGVQGPVNLNNSTLQLTLGFAPAAGQTFTILSGSAVTGQFTNGGTISAVYNGKPYVFSITNNGTTVVLTVLSQGTVFTVK